MKMDEYIQLIPKAELHVHIEGTLSAELYFELAKRNKITIPYKTVEEVRQSREFTDLASFLKIYYQSLQVLQTEQDFYDLCLTYLKTAVQQNIRHAEICFDPQAHLARGVAFTTVINGLHNAIMVANKELKISAFLIMCFMRDLSEDEAEITFQSALPFKDAIVAVGLDSNEIGNPPEKFSKVFEKAREQGFLTVAYAGETGPAEYILQAIDTLKVSRIDQGVACIDDPDVMTRLAATQIPIVISPISNVKLGIFADLRHHPLRKMYEQGLCVTINSDDPAYFQANLNENYIEITAALKLNKAIVYELCKNSITGSFLEYPAQEKLLAELDKFYKKASQKTEPEK